jgi:glycosyltransferase involved in cell wall biosynthesis
MTIKVSAVICTLNRADYLRKAIKSLANQSLESGAYEILVVDNRSTDNTKAVVTEEFAHISNLHYIYEPVLGLSQARNTGWQHAKGAYVAYLDDDAIANSCWLEQIVQAFETIKPQPGCVGGKVEPIWEAPRPDWLPDELLPFLTVVDWSNTPIILGEDQYIAGANMAFPKFLLEAVEGFHVNLGRKGKSLLSNEELLLRNKLQEKNYEIYYDPKIAVKHHVSASRLAKSWFLKRTYWQGVSEAALLLYQESPSLIRIGKLGAFSIRQLITSPKRLLYSMLPATNASQLQEKCLAMKQIGYFLGLFRLAK